MEHGMARKVIGSKSDRTRAAILEAAREIFSTLGFENSTVRKIAERAGVDAALVIRYFGNKEGLFATAARFDLKLPDLAEIPKPDLGRTLVRHFLEIWEGPESGAAMTVLLRSATSSSWAAEKMREIFGSQVVPAVAASGAGGTNAALISSQLLGLAMGRYILRIPPLAAMKHEQVVEAVGPVIQLYLEAKV
jgi:AcrR family transcriptional regulator